MALVDLSTGHLRELEFGYDRADHGATGLAALPDGSLALALPGTHRILRLDGDLTPLGSYSDAAFEDVHSLAVLGDLLFVTATGKDCVLELQQHGDGFEPISSHRLSGQLADSVHVNSVCVHRGELLVSVFGESWRDHPPGAPIGAILALEDLEPLSLALRHPHTLVSRSGELFVLESFSGTVQSVRHDGSRIVLAEHPGYLRGLSFFDGGALVGVSGRRQRSRGLGTLNVAGPHAEQRCGVLRYSPDWQLEGFVDLSWYGREIFDVFHVAAPLAPPTIEDSLAAAKHRAVQLETTWEAPPGGPRPPGEY